MCIFIENNAQNHERRKCIHWHNTAWNADSTLHWACKKEHPESNESPKQPKQKHTDTIQLKLQLWINKRKIIRTGGKWQTVEGKQKCRTNRIAEQRLFIKHSKVVYVGRTSITWCKEETLLVPATTNILPTFLAFSYVPDIHLQCTVIEIKIQTAIWCNNTHIPWVQELVTMCSGSHSTKLYNLTLCCQTQQHSWAF
jgi:hypothetical protein